MMMLFSDAKAVVPPAMLKACITLTLGLTTNSPAFVTCPITYTLFPLTSCTETVTTGSEMYFFSRSVTRFCSSWTPLPRASTWPTKGKEKVPSGRTSTALLVRSGSFQTAIASVSPALTV